MKIKNIVLVFFFMFLFGCVSTSTKLGISDLEWSSYSPEKQQTLTANYKKIVKEQAKAKENSSLGKTFLLVTISGGQIMFPPVFINWQSYEPIKFMILQKECRDIKVMHNSDDGDKTYLRSCYYGNILYLDPSRYDAATKDGTVTIYSSPLWLDGFVYQGINSNGYVKFSNVNIKIQQGVLEDKIKSD